MASALRPPQETPLGSNKHRNKCTEPGLEKEHVPVKQALTFPSPPACWALPCPDQLDNNGGDKLEDCLARLKTLLRGKRRELGVGVGCNSGLTPLQLPTSSSPIHRLLRGRRCCQPLGGYMGHQQSPQTKHHFRVALKTRLWGLMLCSLCSHP